VSDMTNHAGERTSTGSFISGEREPGRRGVAAHEGSRSEEGGAAVGRLLSSKGPFRSVAGSTRFG
jgi:hypothetical protein